METIRQKKVARLLQKELSTIFHKHTTILLGNVIATITIVRVSADLAVAKGIVPINNQLALLERTGNTDFNSAISKN